MAISVNKAIKKATKKEREGTWKVFIGLCKFFSFTHNDIYHLLMKHVDMDAYYGDFTHFRYTLVNKPQALMNKDNVREVVEDILNNLKDDMFSVMTEHSKYQDIKEKWEGIISVE